MRKARSWCSRSKTRRATSSIASLDRQAPDCIGLPGTCVTLDSPAAPAAARWLLRASTLCRPNRALDDVSTAVGDPVKFVVESIGESALPSQNREETLAFQIKVGELQRVVVGTTRKLEEALSQLNDIKGVVRRTRTLDRRLYDDARQLELQLLDLQERLVGDPTRSKRSQTALVSIMSRVQSALSGTMGQTYGPTKTHRRQYEIGREQFAVVSADLKKLLEREFSELLTELEKANAPWTSGRPLPSIP